MQAPPEPAEVREISTGYYGRLRPSGHILPRCDPSPYVTSVRCAKIFYVMNRMNLTSPLRAGMLKLVSSIPEHRIEED